LSAPLRKHLIWLESLPPRLQSSAGMRDEAVFGRRRRLWHSRSSGRDGAINN
jgi:hypothetical protein